MISNDNSNEFDTKQKFRKCFFFPQIKFGLLFRLPSGILHGLVVECQGLWVQAAPDPLDLWECPFCKTLQSPSLVLVKTRKGMNDASCGHDKTEILLKAA